MLHTREPETRNNTPCIFECTNICVNTCVGVHVRVCACSNHMKPAFSTFWKAATNTFLHATIKAVTPENASQIQFAFPVTGITWHTHTHKTYRHTDTHTDTQTYTQTHIQTHTLIHTYTHTHTHTYTCMHLHTCTLRDKIHCASGYLNLTQTLSYITYIATIVSRYSAFDIWWYQTKNFVDDFW